MIRLYHSAFFQQYNRRVVRLRIRAQSFTLRPSIKINHNRIALKRVNEFQVLIYTLFIAFMRENT
jgi:hypothetical protein